MASNKIRGITIELNADTSGIMDGLKDIDRELGQTQRSLNDVNKLLKFDSDSPTLLAQKQEYLTEAISKTAQKLEEEQKLLESLQNADNANETVEQQKALEREIEATRQKLTGYKSDLDKTNESIANLGKESEDTADKTKTIEDALQVVAKSQAFSMIADGAGKVYDALLDCVNAADNFNEKIAKIGTLGASDLSGISEQIKENAADIGVSAEELAEAVYQAISAGVDESKAVEFAAQSARLSIGGFTDAATAVDITTTALNAYGLEAEDATDIMNKLITTQNLGKTTVDQLAGSMGRVIPTAAAYGVDMNNIAAAYAELTAKGLKTRIATTDLNALLNELGDSGSEVSKILMDKTGYSFSELMGHGENLGSVLNILYKDVEEDSAAFLELFSNSTAATAAINLASDGGERFSEILGEMEESTGALDAAFGIMADTSVMLSKRFESAVDNLKIAIGDVLSPILDQATEGAIGLIEPLTEFIEQNPELVAAIGGIVAGVAGVAAAIGLAVAAQTLWNALIAANPLTGLLVGIGAAIGGIAALAASMGLFNDESQKSIEKAKKSRESLEELKKSTDNNISSVQRAADTIKRLNDVEELNASQKVELAAAVEVWNSAMGEADKLIIDETGHIEGNTEALRENLAAAYERYKLEQQQEELAEITRGYAEAKSELEQAEENLRIAQELQAQVQGTNVAVEATYAEAVKKSQEVVDECRQTLEEYETEYAKLSGTVEEETRKQKEANEEAEKAAEAAKIAKEQIEALEDAYAKAEESAKKSLENQRKAFEEFDQSAADSVTDIALNFEKQAENMQTYAENVAKAYEIMKADPEANDLLEYYISQGPSAAGELANLVDAFTEGGDALDKFNAAVEAFNQTEDLINTIASMQGAIESGYTEPMEAAIAQLNIDIPETREILAEGYELQQEDAEDNKERMTEIATGTVTDMKDAVEENAQYLSDANTNLMENALQAAKDAILYNDETGQSTAYYNLGVAIDQSVADGIADNAGVVSNALQSSLNNAINNVDVSGLASRINTLLGEQLS